MRIIGDLVLAGFGQLKNARIENVSSDPAAPQNGQIWFNTSDTVYRGFNGVDVITFATGGNTQVILDALAAETTARTAADAALAAADAAETTARTAADATLTSAVAAETTAREAADATLTSAVAAETTARQAADAVLQAAIDAEATARTAADSADAAALVTETSARQAADATLTSNLASEVTAREAAVAAEVAAREAADTAETSARIAAVSAEQAAREAADSTIRTDFAAADVVVANAAQAATDAEASARVAADALRVLKAGDSMTGNLAFGGLATVTGVTSPVNAADVATKNYVDSLVSGLSWKQAVNSIGTSNPATAAQGERFLNTTDSKIYTATAADTFDAGVAAVDGDATFDRSTEAGYVFSGTEWIQFTGTGQVAAGIGLSKTGNQIDVNLGAGIAQLPSDEVGVDVRATGGVFLTEDGSTPSTGTNAQLAIRVDGSTLELSANGVRVAASVVAELSAATAAVAAETTAREAAVAAEATARAAADTAETSARIAADDAEATARIAGDAAQAAALATEATARAAADSTLQANLDAETTARLAAGSAAADALAVEVTARTAADSALSASLLAETTNRQAADGTLQANLDAEATARAAADVSEGSARVAADNALSARINGGYFLYDGSTSASSHSVAHNIGTKYCQVLVVDSADKVIIPDAITFVDANNLTVDFISSITCKVVVSAIKA